MMGKNVFVTGLIAGAAVGAAAGLLLAPKPGKVTRRYAVSKASRIRRQAGEYINRRVGKVEPSGTDEITSPTVNGHQE